MRGSVLCLLIAPICLLPAASASIVQIDSTGQAGIVAESEWNYLDTYGRVWRDEGQGYFFHQAEWDVPIP